MLHVHSLFSRYTYRENIRRPFLKYTMSLTDKQEYGGGGKRAERTGRDLCTATLGSSHRLANEVSIKRPAITGGEIEAQVKTATYPTSPSFWSSVKSRVKQSLVQSEVLVSRPCCPPN